MDPPEGRIVLKSGTDREGKQESFGFVLPFNPSDIQPNACILLRAAITVNDKLVFIIDSVKPMINKDGTKAELMLPL